MRYLIQDGVPEEDVSGSAARDAEGRPGAAVAGSEQFPSGAASGGPGRLVTAGQFGHGPDDEPLARFVKNAIAGEAEGAEPGGDGDL